MSRSPTIFSRLRQGLALALRETGQALDRVGLRGLEHSLQRQAPTPIGNDYPYKFQDHLSRHRNVFPLLHRGSPKIHPQVAYVAPCSTLIGSVQIGANSSIWYKAILRGDSCVNGRNHSQQEEEPWELEEEFDFDEPLNNRGGGIFIGEDSNIQDGCIVTSRQDHTQIGKGVTVGHLAQVHSATIQDYSLIGMGSIVLEGAVVETEAFVAAGAVVGPNTTVPSHELWVGQPARKLRNLTEKEIQHLHYQSSEYVKVAKGQTQVMELGGNMPESLLEHLSLPAGADNNSELQHDPVATNQREEVIQQQEETQQNESLSPSKEDTESAREEDDERVPERMASKAA